MKKAMISQPIRGLTEEEILRTRKKAVDYLENSGYTVINTHHEEFTKSEGNESQGINTALWYLGRSLMDMAKADAVYFCGGWEKNRGCIIGYDAASRYGLDVIVEGNRK